MVQYHNKQGTFAGSQIDCGKCSTSGTHQWNVTIAPENAPIQPSTSNWSITPSLTPATSTTDDDCNESLTHSNVQKSLFHGMKGAVRLVYDTDGGTAVEDEGQYDDALRVAGHAARAYLLTESRTYDASKSDSYLDDKFDAKSSDRASVIRSSLRRAWDKIDSGHHVDGARIAVSIADRYLPEFAPP